MPEVKQALEALKEAEPQRTLQSFSNRYDRMAHTVVADSGYGSEENYLFMSENGMEAYVKYNYFHMEQRPRFKPDQIGRAHV